MSMYMQNNSELVEIPSGGGSGNSPRVINLYSNSGDVTGFALCFQKMEVDLASVMGTAIRWSGFKE